MLYGLGCDGAYMTCSGGRTLRASAPLHQYPPNIINSRDQTISTREKDPSSVVENCGYHVSFSTEPRLMA